MRRKQKITQIGKRQMCLLLQINAAAPSPGCFHPLSDTLAFIYNPIWLRWHAFVTGSWSSLEESAVHRQFMAT